MNNFRKIFAFTTIGFVLLLVTFNLMYEKVVMNEHQERYIVMNRITDMVKAELQQNTSADIAKIWEKNQEAWEAEYEEGNVPDFVVFLPVSIFESGNFSVMETNQESYIWNVYGEEGSLIGFLEYKYEEDVIVGSQNMMNAVLITCFFCMVAFFWYVDRKILKPFQSFSDYPEKLSKGITNETLPETKNRHFGKFIWGMNMLNDTLESNQKKVQKLEYERQTLLTSIAHGVKTPVANIKLYANAIETGLYQESKNINPKDAEIARKIEKNATDIETLVSSMLETVSTSLCEYEPKIQEFYLKELAEQIEQEYANRMKVKRITYQIECIGNPLVNSDKDGLFHILSQFIENAIKYGDGTGITVSMEKQDEGYFFSVKNKGKLLPESEIPFIFKSFWRGSNAKQEEGSGIGLFAAKEMAKRLGGDIYVKRWEETSEMEFVIFICD